MLIFIIYIMNIIYLNCKNISNFYLLGYEKCPDGK